MEILVVMSNRQTAENMQKALDALTFHWRIFAKRYKGIPNDQLSFDLINEPPSMEKEDRTKKHERDDGTQPLVLPGIGGKPPWLTSVSLLTVPPGEVRLISRSPQYG